MTNLKERFEVIYSESYVLVKRDRPYHNFDRDSFFKKFKNININIIFFKYKNFLLPRSLSRQCSKSRSRSIMDGYGHASRTQISSYQNLITCFRSFFN